MEVSDDIRQTMARNQEMLEIRTRPASKRNPQLKTLKAQYRQETLLASFEYDSSGTWDKLKQEEKREKEYIVKALSCGTFFNPFYNSFSCAVNPRDKEFPQEFLEDRDAVLAYVNSQEAVHLRSFVVPESLRDDKEVMLQLCSKVSALRIVSERLKDDRNVVVAALQVGPSNCLDQFKYASSRLRGNKSLILAQMKMACLGDNEEKNCSNLDLSYQSYLDFLKDAELSLKDEKQLALESMNLLKTNGKCFIFLQYCSRALMDDEDVMMRFIEDGGWRMLEHCSDRLRACNEVVNTAVSQSIMALRYSLRGNEATSFTIPTNDKDKVAEYLGDGASLEDLSIDMETEPEVILNALKKGYIDFDDIPQRLQEEKAYILAAVGADPEADIYSQLPNHLRQDQELCIDMLKLRYAGGMELFESVSGLRSSKDAILAAIYFDDLDLHDVIADCPFHDDDEVMREAGLRDFACLDHLSGRLVSDDDFTRDLILKSSGYELLLRVSHDFHIQNINVVAKVIERCSPRETFFLLLGGHLANQVWNNRFFVLEAIKKGLKGLSVLERVESGSPLLDDAELVRLAVEECGPSELRHASLTLREDRDFILSVVNINGCALCHAEEWLKRDDDVLITAIANDTGTILKCFDALGNDEDFETIVKLASRVRARLEHYDTFVRVFLCGIAIVRPHQPPATRCYLPRLDKGLETTITFKKSIAEYLGVPLKKELHRLRSASTNLRKLGY